MRPGTIRRWSLRLGLTVLAILVLAFVLGWRQLRRSLPALEGDIALPGLTAPASVQRDARRMVTIAALIALPPDMRTRYVRELYAHLPTGCRGLLITLEYPAHEKQGPPFTVAEDEVRDLYAGDRHIDLLERRDILATQPHFAAEGVTALATVAYVLQRKGLDS